MSPGGKKVGDAKFHFQGEAKGPRGQKGRMKQKGLQSSGGKRTGRQKFRRKKKPWEAKVPWPVESIITPFLGVFLANLDSKGIKGSAYPWPKDAGLNDHMITNSPFLLLHFL